MVKVPLETFRGEQVRPEQAPCCSFFTTIHSHYSSLLYNQRTYTVGAVPRNEDVSLG